jgi:hypothetical protein
MIGDRNFIAVLENSRCIWGLLVIRENGARTGAKTGRARGRKRGEHGGIAPTSVDVANRIDMISDYW